MPAKPSGTPFWANWAKYGNGLNDRDGLWNDHPATPHQLAKLNQLNILVDPNITKGAADALIDAALKQHKRRKRGTTPETPAR